MRIQEGPLPKGRAITYACFGILAGTGFFSFVEPPPANASLLMATLFLISFILSRTIRPLAKRRTLHVILIILFGMAVAAYRYALSQPLIDQNHIAFYANRTVTFTGVVDKEPADKPGGWQLTIRAQNLENKAVHGLVLVTVPPFPVYGYGDLLSIACKLEKPKNKDFAYDRYLARYDVYVLCNRPKIKIIKHEQGNSLLAFLIHIKQASYQTTQLYMPEPTASLALPVVFGGNAGISDDITEQFRRTGLTHIMAVSGFNVSLITALVGLILLNLGLRRRMVFYLTSLLVTGYVIMVGAPASAVRAGVMSLFLLLALTVGRLASLPRSVLLVAAMTLLVNPKLLRDDIGWQLSFLALLGLMYILPQLEKYTLKLTRDRDKAFVTALMATVAAQLATAPVILYNFGNFSVIAPLANLLVVWIVPILTIAMMVVLPLAALMPDLGGMLFFLPWVMVKYIFFIVQALAGLKWAAFTLN